MGNYTILYMFENPRRRRQARNFTTNVPKILVLKWSSEQIFSRKLPLGAPVLLYSSFIPPRSFFFLLSFSFVSVILELIEPQNAAF